MMVAVAPLLEIMKDANKMPVHFSAMAFCTDVRGPQRMHPPDSGDPLIFPLASEVDI